MTRKALTWLVNVPPVFIDGTLYTLVAMFVALQGIFSSEEAYKYVNAYALFWGKSVVSVLAAGLTALKMFRSTSYADHLKVKDLESAPEGAEPPKKDETNK